MPDPWQNVALEDVCSIEAALVDPTLPEYQQMLHLGIDKIESATGKLLPLSTAADDRVTSAKYHFTQRDVVYSKIRPELRKATFPRFSGLASADAYPLRASEKCLPEFLLLLLLTDAFRDASVAKSGRTKMPKINRRELFSIQVPIPPLSVQRRIVDLVGALDMQLAALLSERAAAHAMSLAAAGDAVAQGLDRGAMMRLDDLLAAPATYGVLKPGP